MENLKKRKNSVQESPSGKKDFDYLLPEVQKVAKSIANSLNIELEDIKAATKSRIIFISDKSRPEFFESLKNLGFERSVNIKGSSAGGMKKGDVEILHKPKSAQAYGGHGKQNEAVFLETINEYLKKYGKLHINITDGTRSYKVANITTAKDASYSDSIGYDKSDIDFYRGSEKVLGVSIKKEGGARWESSKSRFSSLYDNFIKKALHGELDGLVLEQRKDAKKGKYKMKDLENNTISRVIVKNFPKRYDKEIIFGDDNNGPVVVTESDFIKEHFKIEGNTLSVYIYKLYRCMKDIKADKKEPLLVFNHHVGKANGIELRAFPADILPKKNSKAMVYYIDYRELV